MREPAGRESHMRGLPESHINMMTRRVRFPLLRSLSASLPLLLITLATLSGCSRDAAPPPPAATAVVGGEDVAATSKMANADRARVVTVQTSITVDHVDVAMNKITATTNDAGGYIADSQVHNGPDGNRDGNHDQQTAQIQLRVPAEKVAIVRASLASLGDVTSSSEKVEDVTAERADIQARLISARIEEKRLHEILAQKAATVQDLVDTEKELSRVRENIERLEAQDRVMKSNVALATIHVSLSTKSIPAWHTPGKSLVRAGDSGIRAAAAISVYLAIAFVTVAPTLLPIAGLLLGIYMFVRRRRSNPSTPTAASA